MMILLLRDGLGVFQKESKIRTVLVWLPLKMKKCILLAKNASSDRLLLPHQIHYHLRF